MQRYLKQSKKCAWCGGRVGTAGELDQRIWRRPLYDTSYTTKTKTIMKLTDISTAQDMGIELEIAEGLQAGFPSPAQDHAGETIDLAREMVRHPESTFYARIAGNSMIEAGIHDGDIVVIDRSLEAQNGNYVAACIEGEFTIKEYQFDAQNQCAWLIPHNKDFQKIKVTADNQFCIWGVITHCVHKL